VSKSLPEIKPSLYEAIFSSSAHNEQRPVQQSSRSTRSRSLRTSNPRVNYYEEYEFLGDAKKVFAYDYHDALDLFAIGTLSASNDEFELSIYKALYMDLFVCVKCQLKSVVLASHYLFQCSLTFEDHFLVLKATETVGKNTLLIHYNSLLESTEDS